MIGSVDPAEALDPAFYRPLDGLDGERFHAGRSTTGPWFSDAQHGGPPAALLVRAFERCDAREGTQLSRVTVEVLGPIPAGEVVVRASVERPGRAIALLGAELEAGEESTPWQRLALVADSANGIGAPLDLRRWLFVNTELTLHVHRPPRGEWIGVDARTAVGPTGLGTASGELFDTAGAVGRSAQALVVRPR